MLVAIRIYAVGGIERPRTTRNPNGIAERELQCCPTLRGGILADNSTADSHKTAALPPAFRFRTAPSSLLELHMPSKPQERWGAFLEANLRVLS